MKPHHTAIWAGAIAAVITGVCAYAALQPPITWQGPPDTRMIMTDCYSNYDDVTAVLWATGAYLLTFTATLLLVSDRITGREFQQRDWSQLKARLQN